MIIPIGLATDTETAGGTELTDPTDATFSGGPLREITNFGVKPETTTESAASKNESSSTKTTTTSKKTSSKKKKKTSKKKTKTSTKKATKRK